MNDFIHFYILRFEHYFFGIYSSFRRMNPIIYSFFKNISFVYICRNLSFVYLMGYNYLVVNFHFQLFISFLIFFTRFIFIKYKTNKKMQVEYVTNKICVLI